MKEKWKEFIETGMIEIGMEALTQNPKAVTELKEVIIELIKDDPNWVEQIAILLIEVIHYKYNIYKIADLLLWDPLEKYHNGGERDE